MRLTAGFLPERGLTSERASSPTLWGESKLVNITYMAIPAPRSPAQFHEDTTYAWSPVYARYLHMCTGKLRSWQRGPKISRPRCQMRHLLKIFMKILLRSWQRGRNMSQHVPPTLSDAQLLEPVRSWQRGVNASQWSYIRIYIYIWTPDQPQSGRYWYHLFRHFFTWKPNTITNYLSL